MEDFIIRKVTDNDFEALVNLYCSVWPEGKNIHRQKATFVLKESDGVCYCAEKNGQIVGGRTSFYMPFFYGDRKIKCVQFADSCIHESCRRQGLFLKMNTAFLRGFFDENGGELVYNISVDNSRKAYEKLGWVYIQSLSNFVKYVRPIHMICKARFNPNNLKGAIDYELKNAPDVINEELFSIREKLMVEKSVLHVKFTKDTFEWRLKSENGIRVLNVPNVGAAVYKVGYKPCGVKALAIGEVFLYHYDNENFNLIEKKLRKTENPDIIIAKFSLSHPLYQILQQAHYKGGHFDNHGVRVMTDEMRDICLKPEHWAISFLDIDTF